MIDDLIDLTSSLLMIDPTSSSQLPLILILIQPLVLASPRPATQDERLDYWVGWNLTKDDLRPLVPTVGRSLVTPSLLFVLLSVESVAQRTKKCATNYLISNGWILYFLYSIYCISYIVYIAFPIYHLMNCNTGADQIVRC